nr:hypothetical protein [uncultured Campylobacter sp.]
MEKEKYEENLEYEFDEEYDKELYDVMRIETADGSGAYIEIVMPKTLLSVKRAKYIGGLFEILFQIVMLSASVYLTLIGNNYSFIGILGIFYFIKIYFYSYSIKKISCYDSFLSIYYSFRERSVDYEEIKYVKIINKYMIIKTVNSVFYFARVNLSLFNAGDIKNLEEFLINKNVKIMKR